MRFKHVYWLHVDFAGYCCKCMHPRLMACSYSYTVFLTSALGFRKCSVGFIFQIKKVAFAHIAFTLSFLADDSTMAEYSSIRYTCMLSKLKNFWLPLLFIAEAGILSTFFFFFVCAFYFWEIWILVLLNWSIFYNLFSSSSCKRVIV